MENVSVFIARHLGLVYLFASTLIALAFVEFLRNKRTKALVKPTEAVTLINRKNAVILDIRNNDQFKAGHIIGAVSSPQFTGTETGKQIEKYRNKPIIVVCQNGMDSHKTAVSLTKAGYAAFALTGGIRSWSEANLPLVKE